MQCVNLSKANQKNLQQSSVVVGRSYSLFRNSVAKRLKDTTMKGWSTRALQEEASREARQKLFSKVEPLVRERLKKEFPREFEASWFRDAPAFGGKHPPTLTLSSFKTLLALNGFQRVVKPSGNNHRLYLAEGVVATPPMNLSFNAMSIPFASGYQEFARGMDIDNVGVFGDFHNHFVTSTQSNTKKDRLFAQPLESSFLHPEDGKPKPQSSDNDAQPTTSDFPEFIQEDITPYRITENAAARIIDSTYSRWTGWTQRRIVRPLKDAKYRTRVAIKSANAMRAKFHEALEKPIAQRIWEELSEMRKPPSQRKRIENGNSVIANEVSISAEGTERKAPYSKLSSEKEDDFNDKEVKSEMIAEKENQEDSPTMIEISSDDKNDHSDDGSGNDKKEVDPLETLVVISSRPKDVEPEKSRAITLQIVGSKPNSTSETIATDEGDEIVDSVALYRRMTPSTRILALPDYYVLRHSSASTLVSASLVVFGALPLAYRSYIFSINYDWLVGSGLIATSVIATITYGIVSWRWRARTSQSKTVHEALCARVGARDEAALLLLKEGAVRSVVGAILDAQTNPTNSEEISRYTLIDPIEWSIDFGIMEDSESGESQDAEKVQE